MSESTKKGLLIALVVVAVIAAGYSAFKNLGGDGPVPSGVDNSLPPGSKTGKQLEMEAMKKGKEGAGGGGGGKEERDLSGGVPGG